MMINEYRSENIKAMKGRQAIARGNALCQEINTNLLAPRSIVFQDDAITWGKINTTCLKKRNEENIQYSTINIQCKSLKNKENILLERSPTFSSNVPFGDERSGGVREIPVGRGVKKKN